MTLDPSISDSDLQRISEERMNGKKSDWANSAHPQGQTLKAPRVVVKVDLPDAYQGMNKTEARRARELDALKQSGSILEWWYECWTFKLAHDTRYTPDFVIMENDGRLRVEETKGSFFRDDAKVKTKVFARLFPFPIAIYQPRKGGGWNITPVHP